jgi:hypothetical protein
VILGCITGLALGWYILVLIAESFEKQVGQRLEQLLRRRSRWEASSAAIEIEYQLIVGATSHLNPPSASRRSMIHLETARPNGCREPLGVQSAH